MEYEIKEIKGFRAVGLKRNYSFENGENFKEIPKFWQEIMQTGKLNELMGLMDSEPYGTLGISANMTATDFDYFIAVSSTKNTTTDMDQIFVETQNYAIFTASMDNIQDITKYVFSEWLPASEYKFVENAPCLEIYPDENTCLICTPICK